MVLNKYLLGFVFALGFGLASIADVINPALAEVNFYPNQTVTVEIALNIEAILSDSAQYRNSTDSPNAKQYDKLRALPPKQLNALFVDSMSDIVPNIKLLLDKQTVKLELQALTIPESSKNKQPRVSNLILGFKLNKTPKTLAWRYPEKYGDSAFRYQFFQDDSYNWSDWSWVRAGKTSDEIKLNSPFKPSFWATASNYASIGYLHILPKGLDHILFIIGIGLLALGWAKLLALITVFTLAHSVTLALAVYQLVSIPASIVEPLIALSIAYIGIEAWRNKPSNSRYFVVFVFGLLHGLGFAGVLNSFDLDTKTLALSLLSFNVGVELGQASIILLVLAVLWLVNYFKFNVQKYCIKPIALLITLVGLVWTVERIFV